MFNGEERGGALAGFGDRGIYSGTEENVQWSGMDIKGFDVLGN
jgi:hypothetical protein